nr:MAG TPA: hypothetical protein [Caudoviricetes sp.]
MVFPNHAGVIPICTLESVINKGATVNSRKAALLQLSNAYNMTGKEDR